MSIEPKELDYLMGLRLLPLPGDDVEDYNGDNDYIQNCNSVSELQRMVRFLTQSKPDLIASATKRLSILERRDGSPQSLGTNTIALQRERDNRISPETKSTSVNRKEEMRQKEQFLVFAKVLLRYLEQKNKKMYFEAKAVIQKCVARNKRQEPGYESVTIAMKSRLKPLVGDHYWARAKAHFFQHMKNQNNRSTDSGVRTYASKEGAHNRVACT